MRLPPIVMAGHVPAIHDFPFRNEDVDGGTKSRHDVGKAAVAVLNRTAVAAAPDIHVFGLASKGVDGGAKEDVTQSSFCSLPANERKWGPIIADFRGLSST